jgi:hypothetical protein
MTKNNENSRNQAPNENDAISDFSNVKVLEKNKKRPEEKKIKSVGSQNYNDSTTKYTTNTTNEYNEFIYLDEFIYPILKEIKYDISKFDYLVIENYEIPQKIVNIIIKFLDKVVPNKNNIALEQKGINNDIKTEKEKENSEDNMSEDSISAGEEDEIIQPEQKNEKTNQVINKKDFVLFDESKMMIKDENENEIDKFRKKESELNKKRKRTAEKKTAEKRTEEKKTVKKNVKKNLKYK